MVKYKRLSVTGLDVDTTLQSVRSIVVGVESRVKYSWHGYPPVRRPQIINNSLINHSKCDALSLKLFFTAVYRFSERHATFAALVSTHPYLQESYAMCV
jgi:hypothetical protein